jgi:hypothetical protein
MTGKLKIHAQCAGIGDWLRDSLNASRISRYSSPFAG